MMFLYNIGVLLYALAIRLAAPFKTKAKQWVEGRKSWEKNLEEKLQPFKGRKKVWIHCASLGEFEQGRPIIEALKKTHPGYCIVLTFFSPSGYEIRKNYEGAEITCYMPLDTKRNARYFLELVQPQMALFIKYEFWINFLNTLKEKNIPSYLISAVFKDHHPFFKWYGGIFIRSLGAFKILFVQDEHSRQLLDSIHIKNVQVCGDTRFDRVIDIKNNFRPIPEIEKFKGNSRLLIAGSTWPKDEDLIFEAFNKLNDPTVKLLVVPHDIEENLLKATVSKIERYGWSYSLYTKGIDASSRVLILNTVGLLSRIYFYAEAAYIGGGFDGGLHNCLEASVYGIPVSFYGPSYIKYNEAVSLLKIGGASLVDNPAELCDAWKIYLGDAAKRKEIAESIKAYFEENANATAKILGAIAQSLS